MILCQGEDLCQEAATSFSAGFVVAGFVPTGYRSFLTVRNFLPTKDFLVCIVYESIYLWEEGGSGTSCSIIFLACNGIAFYFCKSLCKESENGKGIVM